MGSRYFCIAATPILWRLSKGQELLTEFLTPRRAAAVIAIYFAAWLSISALVQMQTRLGNWHSEDLLLVGNNAGGSAAVGDPHAWKGKVFSLQLWNRALSRRSVRSLGSSGAGSDLQTGLLASYDFSAPGSFRAHQNFLPGLSWSPASPYRRRSSVCSSRWQELAHFAGPVTDLVTAVQKTNQFTVRIVFQACGTCRNRCSDCLPVPAHGPTLSTWKSGSRIRRSDSSACAIPWREPLPVCLAGALRDQHRIERSIFFSPTMARRLRWISMACYRAPIVWGPGLLWAVSFMM